MSAPLGEQVGSSQAPGGALRRTRVLLFSAVVVVSAAAVAGYAAHAASRAKAAAAAGPLSVVPLDALPSLPSAASGQSAASSALEGLGEGPYMLFRSTALGETYGRVSLEGLEARNRQRFVTSLSCDRVHFAAGRGICLQARRGVLTTYRAHVFDRNFTIAHSMALAGAPSRARMSSDGRLAAMTVFVTGHSYLSADFSTRTSIIDAASGKVIVDDLETMPVLREGVPVKASDINFWGVTFARRSGHFYATLATEGKLYLVEGDLAARQMRVIHEDVECPSLSPDGTMVAFKRRVPAGGSGRLMWRLHVLELASGKVTPLPAETRDVDDQVEWLGNREIVYALPHDAPNAAASTNSWALAIDGITPPRLLVALAFSPAVVR
ncbi:MAG: hypothetical protein H0U56_14415 [Methylibium sp.]|nr:hypothetical protein [Methylibium sp.]